jgi:AcrR family transcriptional regulator
MASAAKAGKAGREAQAVRRVGTLREQQKQFTRDRLLAASFEVFSEDGYAAARVEDVAARAGASRATFYLHFKGKAEIVDAMMDAVEPLEDAIWSQLGEIPRRRRADVRRWLGELTRLWETHRAYFQVLAQAVAIEPEVAARHAESRRRRTKLVALRSETRALLLVVQLEQFCQLWLDCDASVDWDRALDEIAAVWAES